MTGFQKPVGFRKKLKYQKMKKLLIAIIACLPVLVFGQTDKAGSSDHELIERFPNSYIYDYNVQSFEPYTIATGKSNASYTLPSKRVVEGKVFRIFYTMSSDDGSVYEVYTNYKNALKAKGAETIFTCYDGSCGNKDNLWGGLGKESKFLMPAYYAENFAYHAAKFSSGGKAYYVSMVFGYGLGEQGYEIHVVEVDEMSQKITLGDIEAALAEKGKIALYGIYFDTGSANLKAESNAEIALIADYLKRNPTVKLYIVGHTDNVGTLDNNMTLSVNRAKAVVTALTTQYGIASSRLLPKGVASLCPVATNTTDDGRAKNRRVEIVLQ